MEQPEFREGRFDTTYLDRLLVERARREFQRRSTADESEELAAIAAALDAYLARQRPAAPADGRDGAPAAGRSSPAARRSASRDLRGRGRRPDASGLGRADGRTALRGSASTGVAAGRRRRPARRVQPSCSLTDASAADDGSGREGDSGRRPRDDRLPARAGPVRASVLVVRSSGRTVSVDRQRPAQRGRPRLARTGARPGRHRRADARRVSSACWSNRATRSPRARASSSSKR